MLNTRTIGTLIVAALVGIVAVLFSVPKKAKKRQEIRKEQSDMFI